MNPRLHGKRYTEACWENHPGEHSPSLPARPHLPLRLPLRWTQICSWRTLPGHLLPPLHREKQRRKPRHRGGERDEDEAETRGEGEVKKVAKALGSSHLSLLACSVPPTSFMIRICFLSEITCASLGSYFVGEDSTKSVSSSSGTRVCRQKVSSTLDTSKVDRLKKECSLAAPAAHAHVAHMHTCIELCGLRMGTWNVCLRIVAAHLPDEEQDQSPTNPCRDPKAQHP